MGKNERITKSVICTIASLVLTVVLGILGAEEVFAAPDIVVVNATNVNVRSQANTTSKSYGKVSKGTVLDRSEERSDGWSCIDYAGKKAYIKSEFLIPYSMNLASIPATPIANNDSLGATAPAVATTAATATAAASTPAVTKTQPLGSGGTVWVPRTGSKYHRSSSCSNMRSPSPMSESDAIRAGYEPCKKCCR